MDSSSEDRGYVTHECQSQQDATQYRVMYSHDRNTKQVCCGPCSNTNSNANMYDGHFLLLTNTCLFNKQTVHDKHEEFNKKRWVRHFVKLHHTKCFVSVYCQHINNPPQTSSKSLGEHPRTSQARGVLQEEDPPPDGGSQEADGERQVFRCCKQGE